MATIKCGNCKETHDSVAAVRACYTEKPRPNATALPTREATGDAPSERPWYSNPNPPRSALSGQESHSINPPRTTREPSIDYDQLNTLRKAVPAGRYAIDGPDDEDDATRFYKVDKPTEGRWAGYTFLKQITGANPNGRAIRDPRENARILALISLDSRAAMLRYGREIGECGHCGRTLTNRESRTKGIGPICEGRMGW